MGSALDHASLLHVTGSLSDVRDLLQLQSACRELDAVCGTSLLWSRFLERDFDLCFQELGSVNPQTAYKQLATVQLLHPVRFAGTYTDGGFDNQDMRYWIDHAFLPNGWSPHCSDSPFDIHIVGLLRVRPQPYDVAALEHRAFLIDRCKYAAALLFGVANQVPRVDGAMQKLRAWSTAGLERLFADLYEDLAQQDNSTWGRLLLKDPHSSDQDTRKRLAAKYADIQQRALEKFMVVQPVPRRVLARARAAAAASAAAAVATQQAAGKEGGVLLGTGSMPGILSPCGSCPGMGGSSASSSRPGSLIGQGRGLQLPALASFEPSTEAAAAAPAGAEVGSSSRSQGVCRCPAPQPQQQSGAGGQAAGGAAAVPTAEAAEIAAPALDLKAFPHLAPAKLKRYDAKQMDWFAEESMQRSTAVVSELQVSRWGHFTCPVSCGAIFLAQLPLPAAGANPGPAPAGAAPSSCSSSDDDDAGAANSTGMTGLQQLVGVSEDPYCAALKGKVTYQAVQAASAAGQLPAIVQHMQTELGGEWVEFAPLTEAGRRQRAAAGWHWRPVVWFRFPRDAAAGHPAVAAADMDVVDLASDGASDEEAVAGEADTDEEMQEVEVMQEADSDSGQQAAEGPSTSSDGSGSSYATPSSSPTPAAAEFVDAEGAEEGCEVSSALQVATQVAPPPQQVDVPTTGPSSRPQQQQQQAPASGRQQWWRGRVQDVVGEAACAGDQQGFHSAALMSDPFQEMLPGTQVDWSQVAAAQAAQQQQQQQAALSATGPWAAAAAAAGGVARQDGSCCASSAPCSSSGWCGPAAAGQDGPCNPHRCLPSRAGAALVVAPPPPVIQACHQLPPSANQAAAAMLLQMPLACLRSGNALTLKLITAEDNMAVLGDMHEVPNIDVQFVMAKGCVVTFAPGAKLL